MWNLTLEAFTNSSEGSFGPSITCFKKSIHPQQLPSPSMTEIGSGLIISVKRAWKTGSVDGKRGAEFWESEETGVREVPSPSPYRVLGLIQAQHHSTTVHDTDLEMGVIAENQRDSNIQSAMIHYKQCHPQRTPNLIATRRPSWIFAFPAAIWVNTILSLLAWRSADCNE